MTSEKPQYDAKMGGSVILDTQVSTFRYAAAAMSEIKFLMRNVKEAKSNGSKLIFQSLPIQMRRRAMSHHPKRLPRKYRAIHLRQMSNQKGERKKRPSRKYRRRPKNLIKEYIRRQRKHTWLETHLWHAKRFHMIERWGYKLPNASCAKSYRASYRATTKHCLLQDISYYACIEMKGKVEVIREGFRKLTNEACGLGITAQTYLTGRREGSILLFKENKYPFDAIGRVSFMWQPLEDVSSETEDVKEIKRTVWIWVHPSIYTLTLMEILRIFELKPSNKIRVPIIDDEVVKKEEEALENEAAKDKLATDEKPLKAKMQRRLQFMTRTLAYERIKRFKNEGTDLELTELKDTMNRFRLWGPLSQAILSQVFRCHDLVFAKKNPNWFQQMMFNNTEAYELHKKQKMYWEKCKYLENPSQLLSNFILSLNIDDPRIHKPKIRNKAVAMPLEERLEFDVSELLMEAEPSLAKSSLWDMSLRDNLCKEMLTTQQYCEERAKKATVPGKTYQFELELQPIPVILIQRPGSQNPQYHRLGYGSGWDIVAPSGYGTNIWMALIMWGAKAGGLRESETIAREMGTELYLPDEAAGKKKAHEHYVELKNKFFRRPPNRRTNYRKLAIVSPFKAPFSELVRDWQTKPPSDLGAGGDTETNFNSFYVVRDKNILQTLSLWIQRKKCLPKNFLENEKCLIQMKLKMKTRGHPSDISLICLPTSADFQRNLVLLKRRSNEPIYTEPLLKDPDEKLRKNLRLEYKKLLKRLRARRVREKKRLQEKSDKLVHIRNANTANLSKAFALKMQALWVPENVDTLFTVRKQCTRDVFGYITSSEFSFTEATCCSIGYVTLPGLKELMKLCDSVRMRQPMCLIRSPGSRNYRFATFQINSDN